jgi:hypothetical protein
MLLQYHPKNGETVQKMEKLRSEWWLHSFGCILFLYPTACVSFFELHCNLFVSVKVPV